MGYPHQTLNTIGRYVVEERVRRGAMGSIYRARDPIIGRMVAIKTLQQNDTRRVLSAEVVSRFRQEAQTAGCCQHPNIVTVHEYAEETGMPYIVMEFVEGRDLRFLLRQQPDIPLTQKLRIVVQVLEALDYLHQQGVVHRDIKPANIMIQPSGMIKLADFGIARYAWQGASKEGFIVGTPGYMSPEQVKNRDLDCKSDLFSAGILLYELLTGNRPFNGTDAHAVMDEVVYHQPPPPSRFDEQLQVFDDILRIALSKSPAERFHDAASFITAIHHVIATQIRINGKPEFDWSRNGFDFAAIMNQPAADLPMDTEESSQRWYPGELQMLEDSLSRYIGPAARALVQRKAAVIDTLDELACSVAGRIHDDGDRQTFLTELRISLKSASESSEDACDTRNTMDQENPSLTREELDRIEYRLTHYVGPVARILVQRCLESVSNRNDLLKNLANRIDHVGERQAFMQEFPLH